MRNLSRHEDSACFFADEGDTPAGTGEELGWVPLRESTDEDVIVDNEEESVMYAAIVRQM